ncbi:ABC transporter substrate-binding protein [Desulfonema magnum]|nr:ABC transporter substrate binding protein [Desulfonema magnum]
MQRYLLSVILVFLFFLFPSPLWGETSGILIISSNASVQKYKTAQKEFRKTIPDSILEIDLGNRKWSISGIRELIQDTQPELIYCIGTKAYLAASEYAGEKHIVFSSVINWLRLPLTPKTYGVSNELHSEMEIMLFRYIFPKMRKIGVLYSKYTEAWFEKTRAEGRNIGVDIIGRKVSDKKDVDSALKKILPGTEAFWMISDPIIVGNKKNPFTILKKCDARKIPVFSYHDVFAKYGATLIVSVDTPTIARQAAGIAMELLSGDSPGERVQFPAGSRITLNMKKLSDYQLSYNEDALDSVNHIIE